MFACFLNSIFFFLVKTLLSLRFQPQLQYSADLQAAKSRAQSAKMRVVMVF